MRTHPLRIFYFVLLLTLAVLLSACSSDKDHAADPPGNVLRIDVDCDFGPVCPHVMDCSGSTYIFPFIYSFLCVPNPEGELEPDLAVAWDYDPKTYTWRIRLREDAYFHNGDPVTAADTEYSILIWAENLGEGLGRKIRSIKMVDEYELAIQLKQDDPYFLESIWNLDIIPDANRHANIDLNDSPVGSGPFQFAGRGDDGSIILTANENYYRGRPAIDKVIFYYIPDREKSWVRLTKGETDIVGNLAVEDYKIINQYAGRFYFAKYQYNYYSILLYNTHHPLFGDPMVRRALTHAIDRNYIVNNILKGFAEVVAGPMGNHSVWHDPDLKPLLYDPVLALDMLEKAGWSTDPQMKSLAKNGEPFAFELLLPSGSETDLRIARFIKLQLNEVGIRVHLKALPLDKLLNRYYQNREFDAVLTSLTANVHRPEKIIEIWNGSDNKRSIAGDFNSREAADLGLMALTANDPEMRKALFQRFDRLIADLQPGSFLFQKTYIDAMSKRFILNYPFTWDYPGQYRLQYARLKDE